MTRLLLLIAVLAASSPARALDLNSIRSVDGKAVETEEDREHRRLRKKLLSDPTSVETLARRILRSSLAEQLVDTKDSAQAQDDIQEWIAAHPEDAAHLALGFAQDDARGGDRFERALHTRVIRYFEINPSSHKGVVGRLDRAAKETKKLLGEEELDDAAKYRLMKKFFEGESSFTAGSEKNQGAQSGPAYGGGLYDRLGGANPTGYSPRVQTYQSAMNRRRAPGAPALIETGRLDFPTLSYPRFGLRYDIDRLDKTLRQQRAWEEARSIGKEDRYSPKDLLDPKTQAELKKLAAGKKLPPGIARRARAIESARRLLTAFEREADPAKKRKNITRARIKRLGDLRRDAARWIAYAAHAERLARLKALVGFMDDFLRAEILRAPVKKEARRGYLKAGERLEGSITAATAAGEKALRLLAPKKGLPSISALRRVEKIIDRSRTDLRALSESVRNYRETPTRLNESYRPVSRLRAWLDDAALRFLPGTDYAKKLKVHRQAEESSRKFFLRIANVRS